MRRRFAAYAWTPSASLAGFVSGHRRLPPERPAQVAHPALPGAEHVSPSGTVLSHSGAAMTVSPRDIIRAHCRPRDPLPTGATPVLRPLAGLRTVLFDVYGTLLISASGELNRADLVARAEAVRRPSPPRPSPATSPSPPPRRQRPWSRPFRSSMSGHVRPGSRIRRSRSWTCGSTPSRG